MGVPKIPTKTDGLTAGEIGRILADRPRALSADPRFEVVAAKHERLKDALIANAVAIGTTAAPAAGSLEARVAALEGGIFKVFEWNGVDLTQWDIANHWVDDHASNGRITGMGMTVTPDASVVGGNLLEIEPTGFAGGGDGSGLILAAAPIASGRLIVELDVVDHDVNGFGLVFLANFTGDPQAEQFGYCVTFLGTSITWLLEDGEGKGATEPNYGSLGSANLSINTPGTVRVILNAEKPGGGIPRGTITAVALAQNVGAFGTFADLQTVGDFGDAPGSSEWNPLTTQRWGVCQYASGGSTAGPTKLSGIRVYTY